MLSAIFLLPFYRFKDQANAPKEIVTLLGLFNEAQKHLNIGGKVEAVIKKRKIPGVELTEEESNLYYAATDIREFVERMLTEPVLQEELNKVDYKESKMTITEKLWNWLSDMFNSFAKAAGVENFDDNKITANSLKAIFAMIQKQESSQSTNDDATVNTINEVNDELAALGEQLKRDEESLFDDDGNMNKTSDPATVTNVHRLAELMEKMRIVQIIC